MKRFLAAAVIAVGLGAPAPTLAQAEPFIGQISMFGFNFCPRGWALADGQLLPISQNSALFSLFGTIYGGDGRTTFALPDMRGRFPTHQGQGPGLPPRPIGSKGGQVQQTLTTLNLPSHSHTATTTINAASAVNSAVSPAGNLLGLDVGSPTYAPDSSTVVAMASNMAETTVQSTGSNQAFDITNPFQTVTFCVALVGIFPSRN